MATTALQTMHRFNKSSIPSFYSLCRHSMCYKNASPRESMAHIVNYTAHRAISCTTVRSASFITKGTLTSLWDGVTGVSNAGRKRGRAKSRMRRPRELYRGKIIGQGYGNNQWPGLNSPISMGQRVVKTVHLQQSVSDALAGPNITTPTDTEVKSGGSNRRIRAKVPALQRGWTGAKFPGMSAGPPDPIGDYVFEGFDSKILEFKMVTNMTGNHGRKMRFSAVVITGNKNGLAGFALSKSPNAQAAIRKAKNRAAQKLQFVERFEDHTVFHNFVTKQNKSTIYVKKQHKGFGLVCHRAIKTMCEVIGIHNMYAKVEGSTTNVLALTKAFFSGLHQQENHQALADKLNLHVVEMRREMNYMPIVVASPTIGTVRQEIGVNEDLNFERHYYDGKVLFDRRPKKPFYANFPSYKKKLDIEYKRRNQPQARLDRIVAGIEVPHKRDS